MSRWGNFTDPDAHKKFGTVRLLKWAWRCYQGGRHFRRAGDSDGRDARTACYPLRKISWPR